VRRCLRRRGPAHQGGRRVRRANRPPSRCAARCHGSSVGADEQQHADTVARPAERPGELMGAFHPGAGPQHHAAHAHGRSPRAHAAGAGPPLRCDALKPQW
jgi:hypothetical protein